MISMHDQIPNYMCIGWYFYLNLKLFCSYQITINMSVHLSSSSQFYCYEFISYYSLEVNHGNQSLLDQLGTASRTKLGYIATRLVSVCKWYICNQLHVVSTTS